MKPKVESQLIYTKFTTQQRRVVKKLRNFVWLENSFWLNIKSLKYLDNWSVDTAALTGNKSDQHSTPLVSIHPDTFDRGFWTKSSKYLWRIIHNVIWLLHDPWSESKRKRIVLKSLINLMQKNQLSDVFSTKTERKTVWQNKNCRLIMCKPDYLTWMTW